MRVRLLFIFALFFSTQLNAYNREESPDIFQRAFSGAMEKNADGRLQDFMWVTPTYPRAGMFAICNLVLGHLYLLEQGYYRGLAVDFGNKGIYYDPTHGPNWWEYYFEPVYKNLELASTTARCVFLEPAELDASLDPSLNFIDSSLEDPSLGMSLSIESSLRDELNQLAAAIRMQIPREDAALLLKKHIKVKEHILEEVENFAAENFQDHFIIGVHYRGTDKSTEAPRVTYRQAEQAVWQQLSKLTHAHYKIFVATDEQPFLNYMAAKFPGKVICTEATRSINFKSVHHSAQNQYDVGRQAIVDALLLSKCSLLIRTSSNLSLWATFFNPDLPVILLNYRFGSSRE